MGVAPLPKFATLSYALGRVDLNRVPPSISEFGRLHLTALERKQLDKEEKRKMPFEAINYSELPAREFGRRATEPRISISEGGQLSFNALVQANEEFATAGKLRVYVDKGARKIGIRPLKAEQKMKDTKDVDYVPLKWGVDKETKERNGLCSASGAGILTLMGFDYKPGNGSYEAEWNDKSKMFIITLPAEMKNPTKAPKAPKPAVASSNGTGKKAEEVVEASEEELVEIQ